MKEKYLKYLTTFIRRVIKYYLYKTFTLRIAEQDIELLSIYSIKVKKCFIDNYHITNSVVFSACYNLIIDKNVIMIDNIKSTIIYQSNTPTDDFQKSLPQQEDISQMDSDTLELIKDIEVVLNNIIESGKIVVKTLEFKYMLDNSQVCCNIQSLHIQGESNQVIGIYIKAIDILFEKYRILSAHKLIIILPYSFGTLHKIKNTIRICCESVLIDLEQREVTSQLFSLILSQLDSKVEGDLFSEYIGDMIIQVDIDNILFICPFTKIRFIHFQLLYSISKGWKCSIQKIEIQDTTPKEWNYIAYSQGPIKISQEKIDVMNREKKYTRWFGRIDLPNFIFNLDEFWLDLWMKFMITIYLPISKIFEAEKDSSQIEKYLDEIMVSEFNICLSFKSRNSHVTDLPSYIYKGEWLKCLKLSSLHDANISFSKILLVDVDTWGDGIVQLGESWLMDIEKQGPRLVSEFDGWKHILSILRHIPSWSEMKNRPIKASISYTKNISCDILDLSIRTLASIDTLIQKTLHFDKSKTSRSYFSETPKSWKRGIKKAVQTKNILKSCIYILSGFHSSINPIRHQHNMIRYKTKTPD